MDVNVDALSGVDKCGHPSGPHPAWVAISPNVENGVVPPIHDDVIEVGQVDTPRGQKFHHGDFRHRVQSQGQPLGGHGVQHHPVHSGLEWLGLAGAAVEDLVENLRCGLIRIRGLHNAVPALKEVGPGGLLRSLESAVYFGIVPIVPANRFILEDEEEPAGESLPAAHILDEPQVILPQSPALGIFLLGQFLFHQRDVLVRVRPAGDGLALQADGGDFQPAGKAGDDVELLLRGTEGKVDGLDFKNLQVAAVGGLHHTVADVPNGQEGLGGFPFSFLSSLLCVFLCHSCFPS